MVYADRIEFKPNPETGEWEQIATPVTDEWIKANKPNQWLLTADKVQIASDGIDTATVTIQRVTAPLLDDSRENVLDIGSVRFGVVDSDDLETISIDANGQGSDTVTSDTVGTFQLHCDPDDGESNTIEIEVI